MKDIFKSATKLTLLTLVLGLIYMSVNQIEINETYKTSLLMVISFYFGQKINTNQLKQDDESR